MTLKHTHPHALVARAAYQAIAVVLCLLLLIQLSNGREPRAQGAAGFYGSDSVEYDTITLAVVGDLMCHSQQFERAQTANGFDFRPAFEPVKKYLSDADMTFGNLETVTAGSEAKFTGYPMFNSPVELLDGLKHVGFDVLTTANNHSLDRRYLGVERTLDELDKRGMLHAGTARSVEERNTPLIIPIGRLKMGVLAYTYGTNGIPIPVGKEFCVNLIDTVQMEKDIQQTRAAGAEAIAVFIHWGLEYQRFPNEQQQKIARFLHEKGVMLTFGSHPHVLQPTEVMAWGDVANFTIYSLGNFISAQRKQYTDCGMIIRVKLIRDRSSGSVSFGKMDYIPTYVSTSKGFRVLPVADAIQAIQAGDKNHLAYTGDPKEQLRIQQVWKETTQHMNNYESGFEAFKAP